VSVRTSRTASSVGGCDFEFEHPVDLSQRCCVLVMRGRALVVFASAVNLKPWEPSMEATLEKASIRDETPIAR
jgi:hypothetical protein